MSIIDKKITDYNGKDVASAPDVLVGTAEQNKAVFDALTKEVVVPAFNGLIDELASMPSSSSKRTTTLVIGHASSGHTLADCDFLCTGSSDVHTKFLEAIEALPNSGGEIKVLNGTYLFSATPEAISSLKWLHINKPYVKICGLGDTTILRFIDNSSAAVPAIFHFTATGCTVSDLQIDAVSWSSTATGINPVIQVNASNCCFHNLRIITSTNKHAIYAASCENLMICNNRILGGNLCAASHSEILLASGANYSVVANNIIKRGLASSSVQITNSGTGNSVVNNVSY